MKHFLLLPLLVLLLPLLVLPLSTPTRPKPFLEVRPFHTSTLYIAKSLVWNDIPPLLALDPVGPVPVYTYYIRHPTKNISLLWDLGIRSNISELPPSVMPNLLSIFKPQSTQDTADALRSHGVDPNTINYCILSHAHWDHAGDPARFPNCQVVVGKGTQAYLRPAYPLAANSSYLESTFPTNRTREIKASEYRGPALPPWPSEMVHDFFGDGSFLIVDAPGHLKAGHQIAVVRTKKGRVLLGGDSCHHETHLWEWRDGGRMSGLLHEDAAKTKRNLKLIEEFMEIEKRMGTEVVLAFAHIKWLREWEKLGE